MLKGLIALTTIPENPDIHEKYVYYHFVSLHLQLHLCNMNSIPRIMKENVWTIPRGNKEISHPISWYLCLLMFSLLTPSIQALTFYILTVSSCIIQLEVIDTWVW